jgi:hypothetical protein
MVSFSYKEDRSFIKDPATSADQTGVAGCAALTLVLCALFWRLPAAAAATLPVLTRVSEIRKLTPEQAKLGYPVRLRAVVTYYDFPHGDFFVEDDTGGIFAVPPSGFQVRPGQQVEIEGNTRFSDFAADVADPHIRILGMGSLPHARRVSIRQMASGVADCRRIEVEAMVRSAAMYEGGLMLNVADGRLQFKAYVPNVPGMPDGLADARIRMRGTCGGLYNGKEQFIALELLVPSLADFTIVDPGPANRFASTPILIRNVLRNSSEAAWTHRVLVRGAVTLQRLGRSLFIRDESLGMHIKTSQMTPLSVGDQVEVAGFPVMGDYGPILQDAIFRKTANGLPPKPIDTTAEQALRGTFDSDLVRITARLIESSHKPHGRSLVLSAGKINFAAEADQSAGLPDLANGSLLRLTGICSVQVDENRKPQSFVLLLRSAEDVAVLQCTPWWNTGRALAAAGLIGLLTLGVLGWVAALRRRVRRQTDTIGAAWRAKPRYRSALSTSHGPPTTGYGIGTLQAAPSV